MRTNCPNCGAPVDRNHNKCLYCGTPYEIVKTTIKQTADEITLYANNAPVLTMNETRELLGLKPVVPLPSTVVLTDVEKKLTIVNDSLECITDKVQIRLSCKGEKKMPIFFDVVNENLPEVVEYFGSDSRKIFAHEYST